MQVELPLELIYEFYDKYGRFVTSFSESFIKVPTDYHEYPRNNMIVCRSLDKIGDIIIPTTGTLRILLLDIQYQTYHRDIFCKKYDIELRTRKRKYDSYDYTIPITNASLLVDKNEDTCVVISGNEYKVQKLKINIKFSSLIMSMTKNQQFNNYWSRFQ